MLALSFVAQIITIVFLQEVQSTCVCDNLVSSCFDQDLNCQNGGTIDGNLVNCSQQPQKCYNPITNGATWYQPASKKCQCPPEWQGADCSVPTLAQCTENQLEYDSSMFPVPGLTKHSDCTFTQDKTSQVVSLANSRITIDVTALPSNSTTNIKTDITLILYTRLISDPTATWDANGQLPCTETVAGMQCTYKACPVQKQSANVFIVNCPKSAFICVACDRPECQAGQLATVAGYFSAFNYHKFTTTLLNATTGKSNILADVGVLQLNFVCQSGACTNSLFVGALSGPAATPVPMDALAVPLGFFVAAMVLLGILIIIFFRTSQKFTFNEVREMVGMSTKASHSAAAATTHAGGENEGKEAVEMKSKDEHVISANASHAPRGIGMVWEDVSVSLPTAKRQILEGVNGALRAGDLVAILGPSGAGKSTLLDVLACRRKGGGVTGTIELGAGANVTGDENGATKTLVAKLHRKRVISYVTQDDELLESQTVRESLVFSAVLRSTKHVAGHELTEVVNAAMEDLAISHIANSRIGSAGVGGISGGERKRVSVGVELVTRPGILVLDEPTSGLDSHAAEMLLTLLHRLAKKKACPCLFTIHQVTHRFFQSFDSILLLARNGKLAYFGAPWMVESYMASVGTPLPDKDNPAEFLLDLTSKRDADAVEDLTQCFANSKYSKALKSKIARIRRGDDTVTIGDRVSVRTGANGERTEMGVVVWKGEMPATGSTQDHSHHHHGGEWFGVDLEHPVGKHDGTLDGKHYFECKPNHGLFTRRENLFVWADDRFRIEDVEDSKKAGNVNKEKPASDDNGVVAVTALPVDSTGSGDSQGEGQGEGAGSGLEHLDRPKRSPLTQIYHTTQRQLRHISRDLALVSTHLYVTLGMALFLGGMFWQVDYFVPGIQNRFGLLYFLCLYHSLTALTGTGVFVNQRRLFWREKSAGFYRPWTYFISLYLCDMILLRVLPPVMMSLIVYNMARLQDTVDIFSRFTGLLVLVNIVSASVTLAASALCSSVGQATFLSVVVYMFSMVFSGLFLHNDTKSALSFLKYLSFHNYAYEALICNEFQGLSLNFAGLQITGETMITNYGMDEAHIPRDTGLLVLFWALLSIAAFLGVQFMHLSPKVSRGGGAFARKKKA